MKSTPTLLENDAAKRIVRHFQAEGFSGISEALIIRIGLKHGDRAEIEASFEAAAAFEEMPPVHKHFVISPIGHFSDFRTFAQAHAAIRSDFTVDLRFGVPRVYFDSAPVVIDDVLAHSTKYDVLMKLRNNVDGYAFAILLNDPDAAFLDYLGTHHGNDWHTIMGNFENTIVSLDDELI